MTRLLLILALSLPACRPRPAPAQLSPATVREPGEVGEEIRGAWSDPP